MKFVFTYKQYFFGVNLLLAKYLISVAVPLNCLSNFSFKTSSL